VRGGVRKIREVNIPIVLFFHLIPNLTGTSVNFSSPEEEKSHVLEFQKKKTHSSSSLGDHITEALLQKTLFYFSTLPVLEEFRSNLPADATTLKKSGNRRNPKPQKSACMIVHVQRRSARQPGYSPAVTPYIPPVHSGALPPPVRLPHPIQVVVLIFFIRDSLADVLRPVK